MGIGTAGSFLLGGLLVAHLSWRWCLLVNVPLALLLAYGVRRTTPAGSTREGARVDLPGAALVAGSLGAVVLGLDRSSAWGWSHPGALTLLAAGLVGLALCVRTLRRTDQPLVPVHLMADRDRVAGCAAALVVGLAMFAGMFVLTGFLQDAQGLTPVLVGLAFAPFGVGAVVTTALLPRVRRRVAPVPVLAGGLLLAALALGSLAPLGPESSYALGVLPAMLLLGAGGTVVMITAGDVATAGAGADSGVAGALVNATQQVGAAVGLALLTSVMTLTARARVDAGATPEAAMVAGQARAGLVGALILLVAVVVVLGASRATRGPRTPDGPTRDPSAAGHRDG